LVSAILDNHYALSFGLFVVAGLTDLLDGLLARLLKQYTMLGQYLDPVADKLLLSTLFLVLTYKDLIPARVTAMVLGRDVGILVVAAILYATVGRREFRPSLVGKGSTLAQIAAVAAVLLQAMLLDHHVTVRCGGDLRAMGALGHHGARHCFGAALLLDCGQARGRSGRQRQRHQRPQRQINRPGPHASPAS
jgi:CDP-diacylglycerol--glycerol-3-phosphate 3-phosphatidyltransferase